MLGEAEIEKLTEPDYRRITVSEILAFVNPREHGIWRDKSRKGLKTLGLGEELPTKKCMISGSEYERVNEVFKSILKDQSCEA
jgi:hypothetical protein